MMVMGDADGDGDSAIVKVMAIVSAIRCWACTIGVSCGWYTAFRFGTERNCQRWSSHGIVIV